jgi:hypothetical protein
MKDRNVKEVTLKGGRAKVGRGGQMKRVKEDEYCRCTFYTCMHMEH